MNKYFDSTLLKPEATPEQIEKLCFDALRYNFAAVCIPPCYVSMSKNILKDSDVKVCTVIGFPLGNNTTESKVFETKNAIKNGADEIDMVMNIGMFKSKNYEKVKSDIRSVINAAKSIGGLDDSELRASNTYHMEFDENRNSKNSSSIITKVILETCLLTEDEIMTACKIAVDAGADFVKTSTGFNKKGADTNTVALMKSVVKGKAKVKAAGGIRDLEKAEEMIAAGADRLGCSSASEIMDELYAKL